MATITVRGDKFQAKIRVRGYPPVSRTFHNKQDAYVWALASEDQIKRGVFPFDQVAYPTLRALISKYLKHRRFLSKRGADIEKLFYVSTQRLRIAARPVDQLGTAAFNTLRDQWLGEVTASTVARRFTMLKALYTFAIEDLLFKIENAPAQVRLPAPNDQRDRRPAPEEIAAICAATQSTTLPTVIHLALATAMRRGEIIGLLIENIDLGNQTALLPVTKNGHARTVPLTPRAVELLRSAIGNRKQGRVFADEAASISRAWRRAVAKAREDYLEDCQRQGVEASPRFLVNVRLHDCRHEAVSRMIEGGFSTIEAAQVSGHRTLSMLQRYAHIQPNHLVNKLAKLEAVHA